MKSMVLISAFLFAGLLNVSVHADPKIPECQAPFEACKKAEFVVGAHHKGDKEGADNGLWVDCIDAVADGKKEVAGLDKASAEACRTAHRAARKARRGK